MVIKILLEDLRKTLATYNQAQDEAVVASKEAPGRMEARYDTSKEDMARMAESIDQQVADITQTIAYFQLMLTTPIVNTDTKEGSLVEIPDAKTVKVGCFLLVKYSGGRKVNIDNQTVTLVSLESPFGKSLL